MIRIKSLNNINLIHWIFLKFLLHKSEYKHNYMNRSRHKHYTLFTLTFIAVCGRLIVSDYIMTLYTEFFTSLMQIYWIYYKLVITLTIIELVPRTLRQVSVSFFSNRYLPFEHGCRRNNRKRSSISLTQWF